MQRRSLTQSGLRCATRDTFSRNASSVPRYVPEKGKSTGHWNQILYERRKKANERFLEQHASDTVNIMLERMAREPPGWKHTQPARAENEKLRTIILEKSTGRASSTEKTRFDMHEGGISAEVDPPAMDFLQPGTFVETRRNDSTSHGVIFNETIIAKERKYCTLMTNGEIWFPARHDITFCIPEVVDPDKIRRCGPADESMVHLRPEINARIDVLKHIREIEKNMEPAFHSASARSRNLYEQTRSESPDEWAKIDVFEAADLTNPNNDSIYHVFATHKYMMDNPLYFVAAPDYAFNQIFFVRPQSQVDGILQMQAWLRKRQGPIQTFAKKAQPVVQANRARRAASANEEPSQSPASHTWTPNDLVILNFLKNSMRRTRSCQQDPYSLGQSAILKALYPDEPLINSTIVHEALIDLGVFAPWQDITMLFPELQVDITPDEISPRAQRQKELAAIGLQRISGNDPIGPNDFHRIDPLDSVRHDFGDLPVYVIDEPHAEELDDGLSVERIPSEPNNLWVHIHIADPASLIPPTNYLAAQAASQMETIYLNHRSWPLFPKTLMQDPDHGLSMGARKDKPTNVLTFSAKVGPAGDILDYKVRAGIVRDVQVVSYEEVDVALGTAPIVPHYPYGGRPAPAPLRPFQPAQLENLRDLMKAASFFVDRRYRDGVYAFTIPTADFSYGSPASRAATRSTVPTIEPTQYGGFPQLTYKVIDNEYSASGARGAVAEMAKIASRVSSKFLLEKNIPAIRRHMLPPPAFEGLDEVLKTRDRNGFISYQNPMTYIVPPPVAAYSLEPKAHFQLGVAEGEGYIRATSPLRRYLDLVHHWQIHYALLGSSARQSRPPFSVDDMSALASLVDNNNRLHRSIYRFHHRFWQVMLLDRHVKATERGVHHDHDPLKGLRAYLMSHPMANPFTSKYSAEAYIEQLAVPGTLHLDSDGEYHVGQCVSVKVSGYTLGTRPRIELVSV